MKKVLFLVLLLITIGLLNACGNGEEPNGNEGPFELHTNRTDALTLDPSEYEGKSFIRDGIGVVELVQCIDGDTARFKEGSQTFSLRFLGIDTPESTYRFDPWGKAASAWVCELLENAEVIVLEADPFAGRMDNNNRYLGYVWYDGRLINLEVIEQAFSTAQNVLGLRYGDLMMDAFLEVSNSSRRIFGETDPDFDYSKEGVQITVEELVTNQSEYIGRQVTLTGVVSRKVGSNVWLQQGDFGVYVFVGFEFVPQLQVGVEVTIDRLVPTYFPDAQTGTLQVTNVLSRRITILSSDNIIEPQVLNIDEITDDHIGALVKFEEVEIISKTLTRDNNGNLDGSFNLIVRAENGAEFQIRRDRVILDVDESDFVVGSKLNITGPIHVAFGVMQLMITSMNDVEFIEE